MTGAEIAETAAMPLTSAVARIPLGRFSRLEPPEPANRYERKRRGELPHVEVKKLGRIDRPGHRVNTDRRAEHARDRLGVRARLRRGGPPPASADNATRIAYVEVLADEKAVTAPASCDSPSLTSARTGSRSSVY